MKQLIQNITTSISLPRGLARRLALLLAVLLIGVGEAWGNYSATVNVYSSPSKGGYVYVGNNGNCNSSSCGTKTSDYATQEKTWTLSTSGSFTFYLCNKPASNYVFKGWASDESSNSGSGVNNNPWSQSFSASYNWGSGTTHNRYAIFARMTTSVSSLSFGNVTCETSKTLTFDVVHAHAGTITITKSGTNAADYTLSTNSITSSKDETTTTVTVTFNPSCNGTRTATLTISSNNSLSDKTISLSGNGVLKLQTLSWVNESNIETNMLIGSTQTISATATPSNLPVSYSSSNTSVLTVDASGKLTAKGLGTATITASQGGDCTYSAATNITKTFTIKTKDTPIFNPSGFNSGVTNNLFVGDKVTLDVSYVSDGLAGAFSASYDATYFSVTRAGNTITIEALKAGNGKTVTFTQTETGAIFSATEAYTFNISKITNSLDVTTSTYEMFVGDELGQIINGNHVAIKKRNNYDVSVTVTSDNPNLLNYNPSTDKISATNSANEMFGASKNVVLTFSQPETYKYTGVSKTITVTVKKHTNTIRVNSSTAYSAPLNYASTHGITITRDNNNSVPSVSASSNSTVATYAGTGTSGTITTYYTSGSASWNVTQAEDYKYQAGSATMSVNVSKMNEGVCYLLEDDDEKTLYWMVSNSYTYPLPDEELPVAGKLTFEALRVGATESITPSQLVNNSWDDLSDVGSSLTTSFKPFERDLNSSAKSVRFTSSGAVSKHIRNVKVSRLTFLRTTESSLNFGTTLEGNQIMQQFYVEWSSSNTGDILLSSNNPHFTVSPNKIENTSCASRRTLVTVRYLADEHPTTSDITHSGTITIYDKGRVTSVNVTGTTQPQYDLVVSGQNRAIQVEDELNLSDIITYSYEGNSVVPADPTHGANTSPFYFTINIDNISSNQDNCKVPNAVVTYDAGTKKFHACNAGEVTITFTQTDDNPAVHAGMKVGGVHRDNVSYTITVSKHDPPFTWYLENAEWASKYKFSNVFSSDNKTSSWSAVSNTDIAVYRSSTDSIYTNYRSGNATFTVTQEENYYWNLKEQTFTTNVQHGEESTCYLYESPENQEIKVWDFVQATWSDTAVAGKVIFEAMRGPGDFLGIVGLKVFQTLNGTNSQVEDMITNQVRDFYKSYDRKLDDHATGLTFDNWFDSPIGDGIDFTNRVKNVKVTRKPWIKASEKEITLPTIGKLGYSEKTVLLSWSGVDSLRIEQKNNNSHFSVIPDEHFVQILCGRTSSSVLTFSYHSDTPVANETDTFVIYDHAESLEIIVHGTTEDKEMQEIVWNQSFNPILAPEGTINADSLLTAYAINRSGNETHLQITYTIGNTSIATIENGNHLHITGVGRTTITATVAGDATYSTATKTIILNVLDGNGCGSYAYSNSNEVSLFTITSDDAMAVTRPAEDLYFEAKRDFASIQKYVKLRYKVAGDDDWKYNDENGVELKADELPWRDYQLYGPYRLPENTVGIQFYTELGATLSKHVRNVYITQRSYLRKDIDELSASILVNNRTAVGEFTVEYSDKPTLIIDKKCRNVELHVDNPAPNMCGDAGKYTYTVTCLSDTIGVIKDTVTITSQLEGDTLLIPITITVCPDGHFYFDNGIDQDPAHTDWQVPEYWRRDNQYNHGTIPTKSSLTTIEGPVVIEGDAYAYQVTITGNGKVTVASSGSLTVGAGGIIGANVSNLVLEADNTGQTGALRLYPGIADEDLPDALVQIYTTAYWDRENNQKAVWQYIGTPVRNPDTNEHIFYQCWLYQYSPSAAKWTNAGNWGHMTPFLAYAFTRDSKSSGPLTGFGGKLNTLAVQKKDMTYYDKDHCEYHFANSWTAPINLKGFKPSDFHNLYPVIYCYTMEGKGLAREIAAFSAEYTGEDVLPAMQGFFVRAKSNDEACYLTLDYERLVWSSATVTNKPLRAPSRDKEDELGLSARMCIQMTSSDMVTDRIYLLEKDAEGFSSDYEIGYDAPKYFVDGLPCIYTYETSGTHLAVSATDNVVGTYLAINTNASQNYTLTFSKVIGESLGLRDLVTNTIVPISEGMQYAFTAPANSSPMLRFVVVEHEETPEWNNNNGTSLEDVGGEFKIWQSGEILSVIGAGSHASLRIYDAAGKLILSEFFNEATAINLNALPTGVYMVQVNDKTEKVLR